MANSSFSAIETTSSASFSSSAAADPSCASISSLGPAAAAATPFSLPFFPVVVEAELTSGVGFE